MCPQANLSEVVLGGDGNGAAKLAKLLEDSSRRTVGGYFDERISSPHKATGGERDYLLKGVDYNPHLPDNLWLVAGDPSLEIQAQVINQVGGQTLPQDAWKNVHSWLLDIVSACVQKLGADNTTVLIDCNPSFSAYTELAMMAAEYLIVPCSSDGSSARAIDNIGALLYDIGSSGAYSKASFKSKAENFKMKLPVIHSVLLNRSTWYNEKASKAFGAMFDEIKKRTERLKKGAPNRFPTGDVKFEEVPDAHSVAIVCSHLGLPLYSVVPRRYEVHDERPKVNNEPLLRYKSAIDDLLRHLQSHN